MTARLLLRFTFAAAAIATAAAMAMAAAMVMAPAGAASAAEGAEPGRVADQAAEPLEYNRDVRPILAEQCFSCHGPDSAARKADLRLDQRDVAIEMQAIVPGEPDNSELIRRIFSTDPDEEMPPPETKKHLSDAQKSLLARWINQGAAYQLHWSLIPPKRPPLPDVEQIAGGRFASWVQNPIDHFTLPAMLHRGLTPNHEADRHQLARRVSLDLTGLPPAPERVRRFVADPSADAYEALVDELLESPSWGEHRGRYWLDYARYADTHGIHFDNYREMWSYRDWVIAAFNQNMPYDQFTIENLAGDLLPAATLDQQIASGFNRCNMTTNEGGIIDEEYLVHYTRDRTETTSQIWLGMTANCAVCHSHKFDPLSQHEFYSLAAFFNNSTQGARDGNIKDTPPIITVPQAIDRQRWERLPQLIAAAERAVASRRETARGEFTAWLASAKVASLGSGVSDEGLHFRAPLNEGQGREVTFQAPLAQTATAASTAGIAAASPAPERGQLATHQVTLADSAQWQEGVAGRALGLQGAALEVAGVGDFDADQPFTCTAWIHVPASDGFGAILARMQNTNGYRGWDLWSQRRQIGMHLVHAWPENALKVVAAEQVPANQWVHVAVSYDGSRKGSGVRVYYDGQLQRTNVENDRLRDSIRTEVPFKVGQRDQGEQFTGAVQDLRVYARLLGADEVDAIARHARFSQTLGKAPAERSADEIENLYSFWLSAFDEPFRAARTELDKLQQERAEVAARGTIAHVMHEKETPAVAYVLFRGAYDQRRDEVSPNTPAVLPAFPDGYSRNRLGFAQWLLLPEHPLTSRVTVNRFWQEVFGTGIVKTAGDFGVAGELPTHPELLDWLAVDFRESGWDVKRLFKLIVMSATYRQAAEADAEKVETDPENRYLSRGPRFRMDAEMVRDYALQVSGLLVPRIGGPSVKPYQPPGVWEAIAMNVSNTRSYDQGSGEDLYRRSLYTFVKRMAPPASLEIFNAPSREVCAVRRERTNTPLQALVTLNDEQFVEAARRLAEQTLKSASDGDARIDAVSWRLLSRDFTPPEKAIVRDSLASLAAYYEAHQDDAQKLLQVGASAADPALSPAELAAWTMLCNQLMNLDEVLMK